MRPVVPLLLSSVLLAGCMSGGNGQSSAGDPGRPRDGEPKETAAAEKRVTDPLLQAHDWQLAGDAVEPRPWLRFEAEGRVQGNNSCNGFSGSYTLTADALSFGPLAQSKRYCTETAAQEQAFMAALRTTQRVSADGGGLRLQDASGQVVLSLESRIGGEVDGQ